MSTPDSEFLYWLADRLVHKYGESEDVDFVRSLRERALKALIKEATARYDALSPAEKNLHDLKQKRSFSRGMCPSHRDYNEWRIQIDALFLREYGLAPEYT